MTDRLVETLTAALRQAADARGWRPPDALAETVRHRAQVTRRRRTLAVGMSTLAVLVCLVAVVWQSWGVRRAVDGPVGVSSTAPTSGLSVPPQSPTADSRSRTGAATADPVAGAEGAETAGSAAALSAVASAAPGPGWRVVPRIENGPTSSTLIVGTGRVRLPAMTPGVSDWHTTQDGWVITVLPSSDDDQARMYGVKKDLSLRLIDSGRLGAAVTDSGGTRVAYVRQRVVPGRPESTDGVLVVADLPAGSVAATWPEPTGFTWTPAQWVPEGLVLVTGVEGSPQTPQPAQLLDATTGSLAPITEWGSVVSVAALPAGGGYDTALVRAVGDRRCVEFVRGSGRGHPITCGVDGVLHPNPYGPIWAFEERSAGGRSTRLIDTTSGELLAYHPPDGLPGIGDGAPRWEDATHAYACVGAAVGPTAANPCPQLAVRWDVRSGRWERIGP